MLSWVEMSGEAGSSSAALLPLSAASSREDGGREDGGPESLDAESLLRREAETRLGPGEEEEGDEAFLLLNVSGKRFSLLRRALGDGGSFLEQFSRLRHSARVLLAEAFVAEAEPALARALGTYFFHRSAPIFDCVLDFYRTGALHCPTDVCKDRFLAELRFWKIPADQVSGCCGGRLALPVVSLAAVAEGPDGAGPLSPSARPSVPNGQAAKPDEDDEEALEMAKFDRVCLEDFRRRVWVLMEDPNSSRPAKVFSIVSIVFIVSSVLGLIVGSMAEFEEEGTGEPHVVLRVAEYFCLGWFTIEYLVRSVSLLFVSSVLGLIVGSMAEFEEEGTGEPHVVLRVAEYFCLGWFTIEYLVRSVSLLFVSSVLGLIVGSMAEFEEEGTGEPHVVLRVAEYFCLGWFTIEYLVRSVSLLFVSSVLGLIVGSMAEFEEEGTGEPHVVLRVAEYFCLGWFTIEYLVRSVSLLFVSSVLGLIVGSMAEFEEEGTGEPHVVLRVAEYFCLGWFTIEYLVRSVSLLFVSSVLGLIVGSMAEFEEEGTGEPHVVLRVAEYFCLGWFTIEYLVRSVSLLFVSSVLGLIVGSMAEFEEEGTGEPHVVLRVAEYFCLGWFTIEYLVRSVSLLFVSSVLGLIVGSMAEFEEEGTGEPHVVLRVAEYFCLGWFTIEYLVRSVSLLFVSSVLGLIVGSMAEFEEEGTGEPHVVLRVAEYFCLGWFTIEYLVRSVSLLFVSSVLGLIVGSMAEFEEEGTGEPHVVLRVAEYFCLGWFTIEYLVRSVSLLFVSSVLGLIVGSMAEFEEEGTGEPHVVLRVAEYFCLGWFTIEYLVRSVSLLFVSSVLGLIVGSMAEFEEEGTGEPHVVLRVAEYFCLGWFTIEYLVRSVSLLFVSSVLGLIVGSMAEFEEEGTGEPHVVLRVAEYFCLGWFTIEYLVRSVSLLFVSSVLGLIVGSMAEFEEEGTGEPHVVLRVAEYFCLGWFTIEYLVRSVSLLFVSSVLGLIVGSMAEFEEEGTGEPHVVLRVAEYFCLGWFTIEYLVRSVSLLFVSSVLGLIVGSMAEFEEEGTGEPHVVLRVAEYFCLGWFTIEYLVRFLVYPEKCAYLKSPLNIIDALSIGPFYLELFLMLADFNTEKLKDVKGALLMMRILRVMRVARLFRLARYSGVMKSCGKTLRDSYREVGMLVIFVGIMIILFSTTVYFLEKETPDSKFTSIPATFWWCIVTITTVGYGDMTPQSLGGRLVASLASIAGVVVLAFPITVIVENFYRYYRKDKDAADAAVQMPRRIRGVAIPQP